MVERSDSFIYQAFFADSGDQEGYDAVNRFGVKLPRSGFVHHQFMEQVEIADVDTKSGSDDLDLY